MRVLWISHFLPYPPTGGVLQRGFGLLSNLKDHCEVHLLAMNQPRLVRQTLGSREDAAEFAASALRSHCASVEVVPIPSENAPLGRHTAAAAAALSGQSFTERWLASREMRAAVSSSLQRFQPDIVHLDTISLAPYARVCVGFSKSLGHHNIESHMMWRRAEKSQSLVARYLLHQEAYRILKLEREYAPMMDLNVVCSATDAKRLRRLTGVRTVHIAENGVLDPEVDQATLEDIETYESTRARLLFVGRMSAYTNRDAADQLATEIWPHVTAALPTAKLDIVGSSPPPSAIKLASMDSRVTVHGFVADLAGIVKPGSLFICPIRDGGGTKLKILDAMNRGLPIVAHPIALEGIDVIPGKHALVAQTPAEFARAAVKLTEDTQLRMTMAQNAFKLVRERYAFSSIARALAARFRSLRAAPATTAFSSRSLSASGSEPMTAESDT